MSATRKKIESYFKEINAIADKLPISKADFSKTEKYSEQISQKIHNSIETLKNTTVCFQQAAIGLPTLKNPDERKQCLNALYNLLEANKTFRNSLVGMNNEIFKKDIKLTYGDAEKLLKKINEVEKDASKYVEKNSKNFTVSDFFNVGLLNAYIDTAKSALQSAVELNDVSKKLDMKTPVLSNHSSSVPVVMLNEFVNSLDTLYNKLVQAYMPAGVNTPGTLFQGKDAGSSSAPSTKNDKKTKLKA